MDPEQTLQNARNACRQYAQATTEDEAINAATMLAAAFSDLDRWLSRGESLPASWAR